MKIKMVTLKHIIATIIDKNEKVIENLVNKYDVLGILGNGASYEILKSAGAKTADIVIASTSSDEINILACVFAKKLGAKNTIARIRNYEYNEQVEEMKAHLDLTMTINPERFIDFNFTPSNVKAMKKREKQRLLNDITKYCMEKGYTRNTIWTFSNNNDANYSSMTRDNFLGFGASATTLLNHQFKINTFSIKDYIERIKQSLLPTSLTLRFTKRQRMVYYLFWTAYSTKVNKVDFDEFFKTSLHKMYGFELLVARIMGFVKKKGNVYEMTLKGAFYYHYYENFYTLAYIDKMWGILRHEAFPKQIKL